MKRSDPEYTEADLARLAKALGLSYEINHTVGSYILSDGKSRPVDVWIKMKGFKSKRYAAFISGGNGHTKRITSGRSPAVLRKFSRGRNTLPPRENRRINDAAAAIAVETILSGCRIKVSNARHIEIPRSSSVEELLLRLAVAGGKA